MTHIRFTLVAMSGRNPKMTVLTLPRSVKRGTQGGCGTPAIQEQAMYSPLSQKLTVLAIVRRYTVKAAAAAAATAILSPRVAVAGALELLNLPPSDVPSCKLP